ncbi:MAG: hypothetical protein AAF202_04350, partial [Pseudomonadota bacterium]
FAMTRLETKIEKVETKVETLGTKVETLGRQLDTYAQIATGGPLGHLECSQRPPHVDLQHDPLMSNDFRFQSHLGFS